MPLGQEVFGFAAGTLTTFCWLPQAIKIILTRDTKAISLTTQVLFTLGCSLWIVYGVLARSPSVTIFNIVTTCLSGTIVALKLRFG